LLLAYLSTVRYEGPQIDRATVEHDAKALFKAGEKRLGTDEKTFIRIFSERSSAHLAAVDSAYHSMYGNSLKKVNLMNSEVKLDASLKLFVYHMHHFAGNKK
jgi:annexin D